MIFIVRGPEGQRRMEIDETKALGPQMSSSFGVDDVRVSLNEDVNGDHFDQSLTPEALGLKNGQVVYVQYEKMTKPLRSEEGGDGKIKREKDDLMCGHDSNAMCSNCAPLDPWDEKYHKDKMIKYLSFGSYHEMMRSRGKELNVEDYSSRICSDHGSNAKCSKCQERNIILTPQIFRMVDHVEFDGQHIVENFIKNWRDSGKQRFGVMIGKYMSHDMIPFGVKAVVSGIWEPDQEDYPDGFIITESMDDFFSGTGLEMVGMIYTDIQLERGLTTSDRLIRDYFLSSLEIQFIAKMQLMHPYIMSDEGNRVEFSSRFVTIVVTAGDEGSIELKEYQVSNQCMALIRSDYILPTEDPKRFITTKYIVYRTLEKESMVKADPYLPGDFFLVKLTHGCKQNPLFKSTDFIAKKFSTKKMAEYFGGDVSMEKLMNFSLLTKIRGFFSDWKTLLKCVMDCDREKLNELKKLDDFRSFVSSMKKYECTDWECVTCTFINQKNMSTCEMCGDQRS